MSDAIDPALNPALGKTRSGERLLSNREYLQRAAALCTLNSPTPKCTGQLFIGMFFDGLGKRLACVLGLSTLLLAAGCGDNMVPASVGGYNHMPRSSWSISPFTINGSGGPNLKPGSGDHGSHCCVLIPERWHPGMKAKVAWSYDVPYGDTRTPPPPQQAEVEIPDYSKDGPGSIQVHFYPNHRIKVVVSSYGLEHPQYPMSAADKLPWETSAELLKYFPLYKETP